MADGPKVDVVFIGSDHGGFALKQHLARHLTDAGYLVRDLGTHGTDSVDYPDFAMLVAQATAESQARGLVARGIMVDAVGVASAMVCNRVAGIRAAPCWDEFSVHSAREHNDANVLTLGGRVLGTALAERIAERFLSTPFGGDRHLRRVRKIHELAGEPLPVGMGGQGR